MLEGNAEVLLVEGNAGVMFAMRMAPVDAERLAGSIAECHSVETTKEQGSNRSNGADSSDAQVTSTHFLFI